MGLAGPAADLVGSEDDSESSEVLGERSATYTFSNVYLEDEFVNWGPNVMLDAAIHIIDVELSPEAVSPGEDVRVEVTVKNNGTLGRTMLTLSVNQEVQEEKPIKLDGGETETVELGFDTDTLSSGTHDLFLSTDHSGTGDHFTVKGPADFLVFDVESRPDSIPTSGQFEVVSTIRNAGEISGDQTAILTIDGYRAAKKPISLPGNTGDTFTFLIEADAYDFGAGTHEVSVSVGDSSEQTEVRVHQETTSAVVEGDAGTQLESSEQSRPMEATTTDPLSTTDADDWQTTTEGTPTDDGPILPKVPRSVEWLAAISSITGMTMLGLRRFLQD